MKIKVITVKDISKYLLKMGLVFGSIAVFTNFFYANRNVSKGYFSIDSSKFISKLKEEIIVFKDKEELDVVGFDRNEYMKNTVSNELNLLKVVAVENVDNTVLVNNTVEVSGNNVKDNELKGSETNIEDNVVQDNNDFQEPRTDVTVEVMPSAVVNKFTHEIFGVQLKNESDYNLSEEIKDLDIDFNKQDLMIFHTHTCESYTQTEQFRYQESGTFRTTDLNYTVVRVGDELEKCLNNYGYNIVHDKTYHDYPAYTGSYNRSLVTVKNLLAQYTNVDVVIDLHRDAIGDNTYAPRVKIGDECCARLMFVIGTDGGGLSHENWRENLKFAIKLQKKANELYPGLMKPIIVRNSRYNHQLANEACIIEVGATREYFGGVFE